jgi:hypothetical protein
MTEVQTKAEDETTPEIYLYTANGQTPGYEPHVTVGKTSTEIMKWAWKNDLRVYECVPDDPQQMFGRTGNQTLYRVRGRVKGEARYIVVGRDSYYFNKHPFYAKPADRHLLIPDA